MKKILARLAGAFLDVLLDRGIIDFVVGKVVDGVRVRVFEVARIEIARLELEPGDIIILKSKQALSNAAFDHLQTSMLELFPDHEHKIIILEEDLDIAVITEKGNAD